MLSISTTKLSKKRLAIWYHVAKTLLYLTKTCQVHKLPHVLWRWLVDLMSKNKIVSTIKTRHGPNLHCTTSKYCIYKRLIWGSKSIRGFTLAETPLEPDYVYLMHVVNETIYLKQNCSIATTPSFFYVSARATMATYNKCIQTYFSFIQHKSPITKYELEVAFD